MKLYKLAVLPLMAAAIAQAGCNNSKQEEVTQKPKQEEKQNFLIYNLKELGEYAPNLALVDKNNDNQISSKEASQYIKEEIDSSKDEKLSYEEINRLYGITKNLRTFSDFNPFLVPTYKNINQEYLVELEKYHKQLEEAERKEEDEMKKKIDKLLGVNTQSETYTSPLKKYSDKVPFIHLFDRNWNDIIDSKEVDLYVKAVIDKDGDGKLSSDERRQLYRITYNLCELANENLRDSRAGSTYLNFLDRWNEERRVNRN